MGQNAEYLLSEAIRCLNNKIIRYNGQNLTLGQTVDKSNVNYQAVINKLRK